MTTSTTLNDTNKRIFAGPQSVMWQINSESIVVLGGPRALLLQLAHPAVAAGVAQHSNWERERYRRLWRTLWLMSQVTFGKEQVALAAARTINRRHRRVRGVAPAYPKVRYRADDPELAWWVLATLIDTSLVAYEYWVRPLDDATQERYYAECIALAVVFGIRAHHIPATYAAFQVYMHHMIHDGALVYDKRTQRMGQELFNLPEPLRRYTQGLTMGLVPVPVREGFGFEWPPTTAQRWARRANRIRRLYALLPRPVRYSPVARIVRLLK